MFERLLDLLKPGPADTDAPIDPALAAGARSHAIYKDEKFSDHAPITIGYDWS
mgnify:CR=1 FL=1